jgi:phosphoglycolate phosphatase-like HAD superfamily hydrolase
MTDRGIVREALKQAGRDVAEAEFQAVLDHYLLRLEASLPGPSYVVLPGVGEVLARLDQPGVALGLGTGNLEKGAHLKLAHSGLLKHFRFGGYGSDAEPRADVLAAGARRARALLPDLQPDELWVVGDTPKDIAAARAIGARVLAVATGRYSVEELEAHRPDATVPTLLHADVEKWLG